VAWTDAVLLSAFPMFLVMSLLAIAMPAARPIRPWAGVGLAALATVVSGVVITVVTWHSGGLSCAWDLVWRNRISQTGAGAPITCTGDPLPVWLAALPALAGVAVLLGWVWRNTAPPAVALRIAAVLLAAALTVILVGQLNANLGLLALVLLVVGSYAWLWIRDRYREVRPANSG